MKLTLLIAAALAAPSVAAPVPAENNKVTARDYASYGNDARATYTTYGSYPPPAGGYSNYGSYPPPAGGYSTYGSYKRAVDWVKSLFT